MDPVKLQVTFRMIFDSIYQTRRTDFSLQLEILYDLFSLTIFPSLHSTTTATYVNYPL